jgi:quinol monooxygenase YgiN
VYKFIVTFTVKPGTLPGLLEAARPCIEATRREPGCISYDFYTSVDRPDSFVAVECFADKDAHAAHIKTPHFLAFLPVMEANVASHTFETINLAEG